MKNILLHFKKVSGILALAGCLGWTGTALAAQLLNLPFNEGTGMKTVDSASGLTGVLGFYHDPAVDFVELTPNSPSGLAGDNSITTHGMGFLVADDSTNSILAITNGPITIEAWVYIPPVGTNTPGIAAYGSSYKMGLRGGYQVFTLFGFKDITNSAAGFIFDSQWNHLVAAWDPGVGVHFFVNGVSNFVEYTNSAVSRTPLNNYLSLGAESLGNNWVGSLDRIRIHNAILDGSQIDSDPANPKAPLTTTLVSYNFDQSALPATNAIAPPLLANQAYTLIPTNSYLWTNDTPTGLSGDFALAFPADELTKPQVAVEFGGTPIDLSQNNTNYTLQVWVKVPTTPFEDRRVIYRTTGLAPRVGVSLHPDRTLHTTVFAVADFTSTVRVPNDNRWHHIAVVSENFDQLHLYLDGILRQTINRTQPAAPTPSTGVAGLYVGGESNYRFFEGVLDRVVINNDALDAASLDYPAIPGLAMFPTLESHPADLSVEAGGTAVFTASPNSPTAATYQWFYRTNLTESGVAVAGQTTTTLTLNNISEADLGFYSLQVSNAAGVSESYSAKLNFPLDPSPTRPLDFEAFDYTSMPLTGQDGWTATDNGLRTTFIVTADDITTFLTERGLPAGEPTASGSQALMFTGAGQTAGSANFFRTFSGLESESKVTLDFSVRPLASFFQNNTAAALGNVFLRVQTAGGVNAAGFRIGANFSIDYGLVDNAWIPTGLTADTNSFTRITMDLDYTTKTYDFFVDGAKINVDPIPFYQTGTVVDHTSTTFGRLNIFKGANQAGWIMDDLAVQIPSSGPTLSIQKTDTGLVISWPVSAAGYVLESTDSLPASGWTTVSHTTVGDENQATFEATGTSKFYQLRKAE